MPPNEGMALALSLSLCAVPSSYPAVEIGSYVGLSTIYLGTVAKEQGRILLSVDHHRGSEENQAGWEYHDTNLVDPVSGKMDTLYLFRRTIDLAELNNVVIAIVADSATFANNYPCKIGYLFIDGGHSQTQANSDFDHWVPKVIENGILAIHDVFDDPKDGGQAPYKLFQRAIMERFELLVAEGSLRVMRKAEE